MLQKDKLLKRLLLIPADFTWNELITLLTSLGFREIPAGKTGGSRRKLILKDMNLIISLHKLHPGNIIKMYALNKLLKP